jgi:predicted secreted protein
MHFTKDGWSCLKKQFCILVATILILFTCCSSPESIEFEFMRDVKVELSYEDFQAQPNYSGSVRLLIGGELTVILYSNPSTGFLWSKLAQISNRTVLMQTDHKWLPLTSDRAGAGTQQLWTFKTLKRGSSSIYLEYSQPWEGGTKAHWTFHLTVTIKYPH